MSKAILNSALAAGCAALLLVSAVPVWAHHSFASEYDADKPAKIQGTVKKVEWINPHSWITIDVKNPNGTVETWEIEAGAPNAMFRRGFNKVFAAGRDGDRRFRLSGEKRLEAPERPGPHFPRWPQAVHGHIQSIRGIRV